MYSAELALEACGSYKFSFSFMFVLTLGLYEWNLFYIQVKYARLAIGKMNTVKSL